MSRSDSKIDLAKYKPSPEDMRRLADEEAAQERLRKALDNPSLDAAIAEHNERAQPPRTSAPSPWAKEGSEAVDKAALPSAGRPEAPPVTAPIRGRRPRTQRWSPGSKALAAIALAFLPAMIVFILFVRPQQGAQQGLPSSTTAPTVAASAAPVVSASAAPSVEPAVTATASATGAPTAAPQHPAPAAPRRPQRQGVDDPYDAAPSVTAPRVSPSVAPSATPTSAPPARSAEPPTVPKIID